MCQITILNFFKLGWKVEGSDLAHFFWGIEQNEKLSENEPSLTSMYPQRDDIYSFWKSEIKIWNNEKNGNSLPAMIGPPINFGSRGTSRVVQGARFSVGVLLAASSASKDSGLKGT